MLPVFGKTFGCQRVEFFKTGLFVLGLVKKALQIMHQSGKLDRIEGLARPAAKPALLGPGGDQWQKMKMPRHLVNGGL